MVSAPAAPRIALAERVRRAGRSDGLKALVGAHLVAGAAILLYSFAWLQPAGLWVYDALHRAWAGEAASSPVVLLGASERDLGRWGWPLHDEDLANILERAAAGKPRAIGVDLYRDHPQPPGTDHLNAVIAAHPEIFWVFKLQEGEHPEIPPPAVLRGSDRMALADVPVDSDGVVRRGLLFADDGTTNYPGMAMALALAYLAHDGIKPGAAPDGDMMLGKADIAPLDETRGPYLRLDSGGYQVLYDYHGGVERLPIVSLTDFLGRDDSAALVRDKIVILGVAAESVKDSFLTPFNTGFRQAPPVFGIAMHGYLAEQLVREASAGAPMLWGFDRRVEGLMIWLVALAGAALGYGVRTGIPLWSGIAAGVVAIGGATYVAFGWSLLLPSLPLLGAWAGSSGLANQLRYAATNRERARLRRSFEHYLPPAVIAEMMATQSLPRLGGERREISVIFTDIQNFTTLSETMDPEELAALLNDYFAGACQAIFDQGGLVYEFIGDAILAFFNAPHAQPDHADRAVAAALALDRFAYPFYSAQRERGVGFGITRVGVHTGIALVGNVGTADRLKYTALGDMLNTGSRLEGLNKMIGSRICVSGETVRQCRQHSFRPIGDFVVKGRHEKVAVFEPVAEALGERAPAAAYEAAFEALSAARPDASELFADLYRRFPDDPCVAFHHQRLEQGEQGILVVMTEK
ncbi:MAG TPA: adenylate/guanylate cyclase domain-containing protein [Stellaceae bacterium]|nr:adenylate/guanylate cyclase domain-containing protein [Stellaceae bacterium]